jgi:hypothetical protein
MHARHAAWLVASLMADVVMSCEQCRGLLGMVLQHGTVSAQPWEPKSDWQWPMHATSTREMRWLVGTV